MDINNIKTFTAIGIIGVVIGILYLTVGKSLPIALTVFFITVYVITSLRYIFERRRYKKHNAALASTQFLLLPYSLLLVGTYISSFASVLTILNIELGSLVILINSISVSLTIPQIILYQHFKNYHRGKWPAMAIRRKIHYGKKRPLFIQIFFVLFLIPDFLISLQIDIMNFIFMLFSFGQLIRYYIVPAVKTKDYGRTQTRRPSQQTRSSTRARSTSRSRPTIPTTPRSGQRTVSTRSSGSSSSSRRKTKRTPRPRSTSPAATVDRGIDVPSGTRSGRSKITSPRISAALLPSGRSKREDLSCIICYMDFDKKDNRNVVLCPHCKYPAHEDEFHMWVQSSHLCARCNKEIPKSYIRRPKYVIRVKTYIREVIEKIR